ncbi:hypothetical protein [Solirubrum puertoriconensis]|uniref:STAS/SEC14 domain-containing protein n=1 Tax=Solirubrum puertoriconensis TaxID=1751427 RepID=A0A9X0L3Q2_SOLP1|nr:hypothetical protein [Solirubrum puertoriconensis]KUG06741.1 hypothetical protein ASU33_05260 [Solirubrum puertoriconensis]
MQSAPATLRVYFENASGRVAEHPEGFAVVTWYKGTRQLDDFRAVLNHLDRLLRLRNGSKLLADQRLMTPFTPAESNWVVEDWLPRAVGEGPYRYAAVLLPLDVFARLSTKNVLSESQEKFLAYQFCADEAEAAQWLRQLP